MKGACQSAVGIISNRLMPGIRNPAGRVADDSRDVGLPVSLQAGFVAFAVWLLQFARVARMDSTVVYDSQWAIYVPFIVAFMLFALLARARKLARVHLSMTVVSLLSCTVGFVFLTSASPPIHLTSIAALMVLAAYGTVAWGSVLRNLALDQALFLMIRALVVIGVFQLVFTLGSAAIGMTARMHTYTVSNLALLSILPLVSGFSFARQAFTRIDRHSFTRSSDTDTFQAGLRQGVFLPIIPLLFFASVLTMTICGFSYSPYLFDYARIDAVQGCAELIIAVLALLITRRLRRDTIASIFSIFQMMLAVTLAAMAMVALGQTGVFFAQGSLRALGDAFFLLALLFSVSPLGKGRLRYYPRLMVAVLCSGCFWAFGLGSVLKRILGYDQRFLVMATMLCLVCIGVLLVLALFTTRNARGHDLREDAGAGGAGGAGAGAAGAGAGADAAVPAIAGGTAADGATTGDRRKSIDLAAAQAIVDESNRIALAPFELTERERQIAVLLFRGTTAQEIGDDLGISKNTVRFHLKNTYAKCGVTSRTGLMALAAERRSDGR
jgi:DNA-binding CsgD family transcriptional regulator